MAQNDPICIGCNKRPSELPEYSTEAKELGISADDYCKREEGTLNRSNGHFLCTKCYIDQGMPVGENGRRWTAP